MTKPFVPEFTNRLDAVAYIHMGRGGKLERPTKDSWNTKVVQPTASDDVQFWLNGEPLFTWWWDVSAKAEAVTINKIPTDFTARKRMNDYLLAPRGLEIVSDNAIMGIVGEARGNQAIQHPIPGRIGMLVAPTTLDDTNTFGTLGAAPVRWDKKDLRRISDEWANSTYELLKSNPFAEQSNAPPCIECSPIAVGAATPLGTYTHNFEHLFAHAVAKEFNIGLLTLYARMGATDLNLVASGSILNYGTIVEVPTLEKYMADRMFVQLEHASHFVGR